MTPPHRGEAPLTVGSCHRMPRAGQQAQARLSGCRAPSCLDTVLGAHVVSCTTPSVLSSAWADDRAL